MNQGFRGWSVRAPGSNLLSDVVLTEGKATIASGELAQHFRDLRMIALLRTTGGAATTVNIFFNGDTTAGHYTASGRISIVASAAQTAGQFTLVTIYTGDYTNPATTIKSSTALTTRPDGAIENDQQHWTATAPASTPIFTVTLSSASGVFVAGSSLRIYGEPYGGG